MRFLGQTRYSPTRYIRRRSSYFGRAQHRLGHLQADQRSCLDCCHWLSDGRRIRSLARTHPHTTATTSQRENTALGNRWLYREKTWYTRQAPCSLGSKLEKRNDLGPKQAQGKKCCAQSHRSTSGRQTVFLRFATARAFGVRAHHAWPVPKRQTGRRAQER